MRNYHLNICFGFTATARVLRFARRLLLAQALRLLLDILQEAKIVNVTNVQPVASGRFTVTYVLAIAAIITSLVLCYHKGLEGPFVLDDLSSVSNAVVDSLDINELLRVSTSDRSGIFGRSLSVFTFAVNSYFAGASTFAYKATNLTIHIITALLISKFLMAVFVRLNNCRQTFTTTELRYLALFCTAVWALHPLQVSTVLYVVQRMAMLSTLFSMLALLTYIYLRTQNHSSVKRGSLILVIIVSTVLACLSKENGVLVIPQILLLEFAVIHGGMPIDRKLRRDRNAVITGAALFGLSLILLFLYKYHTAMFSGYIIRDYNMWDRLMTEPGVLLLYLKMILLPNLADMSLYHDTYPVQRSFNLLVGLQFFTWISLIVMGYIYRHRFPVLLFGVGLFLIAHSLESTVFPLELVFEHRNYFGLLGIISIVGWAAMAALKSIGSARPAVVASLGVLALLSFQTSLRSAEWSSAESFAKQALVRSPDSIRALSGWTTYLAQQREIGLAINHLQQSHEIRPDSPHFLVQLLMFVGATSEPNPELLAFVKDQLRTKPFKSEELASLGELLRYSTEGRYDWPSRADIAELYRIGINNNEKYLKKIAESFLFGQYSDLLKQSGNNQAALAAIQTSVQLDPGDPEGLIRLAELQFAVGNPGSATQTLLALDQIDHDESIAEKRNNLADRIIQSSIATSEMD